MTTVKQTIDQFLCAISQLDEAAKLPDNFLTSPFDAETYLRHLFATSANDQQLADPYVGLIDIFSTFCFYEDSGRNSVNRLRARAVEDFITPSFFLHAYRLFPIVAPRKKEALVPDFTTFSKNWDIFTHGVLAKLDWTNVVAAGGSIQACMLPFPPRKVGGDPPQSTYEINMYYQKNYATADVDLFIWGLTAEMALSKIEKIYSDIRDSVPWKTVCVRKANTISVHTLFPYRPVQIVLRLYHSPAEILAGFDIDAACFAFDGTKVWTNPRGFAACVRRCNTVDITRRSPSYESRLAKYARRGFEIYLPSLQRERINEPFVYNRNLSKFPDGLARLLVLEKMAQDPKFYRFLSPKFPRLGVAWVVGSGRIPLEEHQFDENDYDLAWTGVPYGKCWDADAIAKLIRRIDRKMNDAGQLVEDGRDHHHHVVVASKNIFKLLEGSFCEGCPESHSCQDIDSTKYIVGPVKFISANAGRQLISGSFNPIDIGDWTCDAYYPLSNMGNTWSALAARVISFFRNYVF